MGEMAGKRTFYVYYRPMASLPQDRISRVVLVAFAAVIISLTVALFWIGREARRSEAALSREVGTVQSVRTIGDLQACLGHELRMDVGRRRRVWSGSAADASGLKAFNSMTDIGVSIHELGNVRKVVISTRGGRALRPAELSVINSCVGDAN